MNALRFVNRIHFNNLRGGLAAAIVSLPMVRRLVLPQGLAPPQVCTVPY